MCTNTHCHELVALEHIWSVESSRRCAKVFKLRDHSRRRFTPKRLRAARCHTSLASREQIQSGMGRYDHRRMYFAMAVVRSTAIPFWFCLMTNSINKECMRYWSAKTRCSFSIDDNAAWKASLVD